ncbi:MAG: hypothetical protein ACYCXW_14575 [Solirubrobacteraceae bacterium]
MTRAERRAQDDRYRVWKGSYRPYDLVKEVTIALGAILALTLLLTILFSSPDESPSTVKSWSRSMPIDFVTTATSELEGTSGTASYGPPYNHASTGQHIAFIHLQNWLGTTHPIHAAQDFVLAPLRSVPGQPAVQAAVTAYEHASAKQQAAWTGAYEQALTKATLTSTGTISVPSGTAAGSSKSSDSQRSTERDITGGTYGPLPIMMNALLSFAQSGALDGALLTNKQFYQTNYTKPLMFIADGGLLAQRAQADHLLGEQWGMMNETGSYPGQVWLWLYTFWYQIKPFSTSANADVLVMAVMGVLSLAFVLIPFLPGINSLPRRIPIYRLIWRDHYAAQARRARSSTG